jgi:hypothetical protein
VERLEEAVESDGQEEREQDLGDEDAGEEEDSGGGEQTEPRVKSCALAEGPPRPMVAEQRQKKDADGLGQVGGEGVEAEQAEAESVEPVGERGFFEVADAIDVQGDEVAGEGHVAGGVGVGGIGIVEQRRREERGEEEEKPQAEEETLSCDASRGTRRESCRLFGEWFGEDLIGHEFGLLYQHKLLEDCLF